MALTPQQNLNAFGGRVLLVVLLVLPLISVTLYFREGDSGPFHQAQDAAAGFFGPFKMVGGSLGAGGGAVTTAMADAGADEASLSALKAQNKELREEIAKLEEYRQEAQRLSDLLGLKDTYYFDSVAARVSSRSVNAWEKVISIDKGSSDGIITGLTVMGPAGVVGQVISTTPFSSEVRLLTDPQSGVAVLIQSNRAEGIVRGSIEGLLYLENISDEAKVQVGDVIVTSGLGGSYARGLIIGMVVKVDENQGGATRKIVVAPNETTGPLEDVLVVTKMNSEGKAAINTKVDAPGTEDGTDGSGNAAGTGTGSGSL
ncbi:MAG: rod shape-determining protein MreC [Coriobacteriaceae bacterium]|jgi:rod shape-determining protein MreC|nr:rod shape-determining protein MreC [Coriobacteriaceae bacterium]